MIVETNDIDVTNNEAIMKDGKSHTDKYSYKLLEA